MRVHGEYIVALVVAVTGAGAYVAVTSAHDRANQHDQRAAQSLAHAIPAPSGAIPSRECHGDGLVACWSSTRSVTATAADLAAVIRTKGARPRVDCNRVTVGSSSAPVAADECSVMARFGAHATAVFVTPVVQQTGGKSAVTGSLISLSAS
jgi:hypothetical protein